MNKTQMSSDFKSFDKMVLVFALVYFAILMLAWNNTELLRLLAVSGIVMICAGGAIIKAFMTANPKRRMY